MQRTILLLLSVALVAGAAHAAEEKYQRKSGLWELKRTSTLSGGQTRLYQMCVDQASDDALSPLADGQPGERCQTVSPHREGDRLSVDASCNISGSVATTHAVITGRFDSAYKVESRSTFAPPLRRHADSTTLWEAKWTGPCKANMKPGDVILPSGVKVSSLNGEAKADEPKASQSKAERTGREKRQQRHKKGAYVPQTTPSATTPPATTGTTPAIPPSAK